MMIAIFGARRSGSRPWDIPELFVSQVWERREADRSRLNAVQERIDAIRASKPDNGPATGTRH